MTEIDILALIDKNSIENKKYLHILNAMNDWPTEVGSVSDYYSKVKNFLSIDEITFKKVKNAIKCKKAKNNSWNLESISELILFLR